MGTVSVFGVRHHGPGSSRSLRAALAALEPDAVLVEGPPEAEPVVALAADEEMVPPVALLAHRVDDPSRAAFWPFASFSPEWVAVRHALATGVPLRFIDLPVVHQLAEGDEDEVGEPPHDPLGVLAAAGGHGDPESWWEDVVEHRDRGAFVAIAEAMAALREQAGPPAPREARREASMRGAIRTALKDGFERIAVVCGAWHAPVLEPGTFPPAAHDAALLRGLARTKVACTWVPWTNERLAFASGYGAGVTSPGWYAHLFEVHDAPVERWMQRVAALLREEDLDASPASVVEAVRAATALAALRDRPVPGLDEVDDAALAVLCGGSDVPLALIERRLVVGDVLGRVPDRTPMVPLAEDLRRRQRSLRLKPEAASVHRELDLRRDVDLERSRLLWRLVVLDVPWGHPAASEGRSRGTFKEAWTLAWEPGLEVALIDRSRYGTTVEVAATTRAVEATRDADATLFDLTRLVELCLLAGLSGAVGEVLTAVGARASRDADVGRLMDAVVPLARVSRYGSVRAADADLVGAGVEALVPRICVGLGPAAASLDDDAAAELNARIVAVHDVLGALARDDLRDPWLAALRALADRDGVHGLVGGRCVRLLLDAGRLDADEARRRFGRALSRGADPAAAAAFAEGFLEGSGLVLLHDTALLGVLDAWIATVPTAAFDALMPLLRRTFATFALGERRQIGARVRSGGAQAPGAESASAGAELDLDRARPAARAMAALLGLEGSG